MYISLNFNPDVFRYDYSCYCRKNKGLSGLYDGMIMRSKRIGMSDEMCCSLLSCLNGYLTRVYYGHTDISEGQVIDKCVSYIGTTIHREQVFCKMMGELLSNYGVSLDVCRKMMGGHGRSSSVYKRIWDSAYGDVSGILIPEYEQFVRDCLSDIRAYLSGSLGIKESRRISSRMLSEEKLSDYENMSDGRDIERSLSGDYPYFLRFRRDGYKYGFTRSFVMMLEDIMSDEVMKHGGSAENVSRDRSYIEEDILFLLKYKSISDREPMLWRMFEENQAKYGMSGVSYREYSNNSYKYGISVRERKVLDKVYAESDREFNGYVLKFVDYMLDSYERDHSVDE